MSKSEPENQEQKENQRAWMLQSEAIWREAHAIAAANPGVDTGDVYHALRSRSPASGATPPRSDPCSSSS